MKKFNICPNAYYNYKKDRKRDYRKEKASIQRIIVSKYHREDGVPGYYMMRDYLENENGIVRSALTIHYYMKELGLQSIVRRKKPGYKKGTPNRVFPNILNREFDVKKI